MSSPVVSATAPLRLDRVDSTHGVVSDYKELLKPGITGFVVVMAAASYLMAADPAFDWLTLVGLMVGTGLTAGGSGALNHAMERRYDALMARTRARPVASGRVGRMSATLYGLLCAVAGTVVLALTTNVLTTGLAALTVVLYVLVYTPLKRRTVHNTLVGAIPGALPALGGVTAATGVLDSTGWSLFAILYLWQLPHFFALAWMYKADYAAGGFKMLPQTEGGARAAAWIALVATLLLLIAGMLPSAIGPAGLLYLVGMAGLGTAFTIPAFSFFSEPTDERARRLLLASIVYVPVFFALVVLDVLLG
ncbi:MAG: heme o synthase [Bacteroidota bacterium]